MTPQEALALIDNVLAQVNLNRQQHAQVVDAVRTIQAALEPLSLNGSAVPSEQDKEVVDGLR